MCELFGMSSNLEVKVSFTWRGFRKKGEMNKDGWGIAWHKDGKAGLAKEPSPSVSSEVFEGLLREVKGKVIISHVRYASQGEPCYQNTHPFVRRFLGRDWSFAHNGDLGRFVEDKRHLLRRYFPIGETDSECAFCYILDKLSEAPEDLEGVVDLSRRIWEIAEEIGSYGIFNFLLSDGDRLFAYRSLEGDLKYLLRIPPHRGTARLIDDDFEVNLEEMKGPEEYAAIVATSKLTDEDWRDLIPGSLYVFYNGDLLFRIEGGEVIPELTDLEEEILGTFERKEKVSLKEMEEEIGRGSKEILQEVKRLENKGILEKAAEGEAYRMSEEGKRIFGFKR